MTNTKNSQYIIHAKGKEIAVISTKKDEDYISLTDIAKYKNQDSPADVVKNWIRSRDTIEFLGLWEQLSNPDFKLVDFDQFRQEADFEYVKPVWPEEIGKQQKQMHLFHRPEKISMDKNWKT